MNSILTDIRGRRNAAAAPGGIAEMRDEPVRGERGDLLERAGLFEQMSRAWHDVEPDHAGHASLREAIQSEHFAICAADDEQGRCVHPRERIAGQVRAPAA